MDGRSVDEDQSPMLMVSLTVGLGVHRPCAFSSLVCFSCRTELIAVGSWSDLFEDLKEEQS